LAYKFLKKECLQPGTKREDVTDGESGGDKAGELM